MMQLIHYFIDKGDQVTFVSSANDSFYQEDLSQLKMDCAFVQLNDSSFNVFIEKLNPDAVIFDRFMTEEQFAWRVMDTCPNAIRILDTEDLHFLREARQTALKRGEIVNLEHFRSDLQLRELAAIYRSDLSLIVSDVELQLLNETYQIPIEKLVHLPMYVEESQEELPNFDQREGFIFIGNFWHEPNWDAVRYLKSTIWPLIRKIVPKATLSIYGAYCSEKVYQLANEKEGFLVKGRADDAFAVVSKSKVSLAPLRFGAGIKGKLLESMVSGTPSVSTSIGAEGITNTHDDWGGFIEDHPEKFARQAARLYLDEQEWNAAQQRGLNVIRNRFTKENFTNKLEQSIEELSDLMAHRNKSLVSLILQKESHHAARYLSIWIEEKKRNGRGGS